MKLAVLDDYQRVALAYADLYELVETIGTL